MAVYVMRSVAADRFKVGISRAPQRRYREIKSEVPDLELLRIIEVEDTLEQRLHVGLAAFQSPLQGCGIGSSEWFALDGLPTLDSLLTELGGSTT